MKKIKKLTLNKEVVSILGGNDMNLVKGGTYVDGTDTRAGATCGCPVVGGGSGFPTDWTVNMVENKDTMQGCGDSIIGNSCNQTHVGSCTCPSAAYSTPCC